MRKVALALVLLTAGLAAGCGGGGGGDKDSDLSKQVQAACDGSAIDVTSKLPPSFPQIEEDKLVYTQESEVGPTQVVEGYFNGDVEAGARGVPEGAQGLGLRHSVRRGRGAERLRDLVEGRGPDRSGRDAQRVRRER